MPVTKELKRQNFNVTPDQEAELLALQSELGASSVKDAIFKAVRLALLLKREVKKGRRISLKDQAGNITEVIVPELEGNIVPRWTYLVERPESWKKQLFVKGRRLTAFNVWSDMISNKMTPEEAADNWDLPIEAINEIIEYCGENGELIKKEADQERQSLVSHGIKLSA